MAGGSERIRILSAGNVVIGSSVANPVASASPAALTLRKFSSATASTTISDSYYLGVGGNEYNVNSYRLIGFGYSEVDTSSTYPAYIGYQEKSTSGYTYGDLIFATRSTTGATHDPVERMRIASSGNVGIGTTDPDSQLSGTKGLSIVNSINPTLGLSNGSEHWLNYLAGSGGNNKYRFWNNGVSEVMTLTYAGDVGIGTDSPNLTASGRTTVDINGTSSSLLALSVGGVAKSYIFQTGANLIMTNLAAAGGHLAFENNGAERMRITSGGDVLIGTQSQFSGANETPSLTVNGGIGVNGIISGETALVTRPSSNNYYPGYFLNISGDAVGTIYSTSTATTYNTSSDYRLKEDLQDFAGLEMVSKIPVYDYKWKVEDSRSYGVLAHELQEVLPDAVTGKKDDEKMQGVDYSKIVPLLIKSIQELKAEIDILKAK
tara:strand:- start:139 stop:1437 length:1299 start_codon:yes stop_codon:yes gene_type:complete